MDDPNLVNIFDACNKLCKYPDSFTLINAFILNDVVEEFPLLHVLHDQEQLFGRLDDFVELDDIWMPDELQYVYLSRDSFDVSHFSDFVLFEYFYGHILIGWLMKCGFDLAESALADCLP